VHGRSRIISPELISGSRVLPPMEPVWWHLPLRSVGISGATTLILLLSGRDSSSRSVRYLKLTLNSVSLFLALQRTSISMDMGMRLQETLSLCGTPGMLPTRPGISLEVRPSFCSILHVLTKLLHEQFENSAELASVFVSLHEHNKVGL